MAADKARKVSFRPDQGLTLTALEVKLLVGPKGKKLFELLHMTPAAEQYLEYNEDLKGVVEKW
jgi:hypothetical protein